MDSAISLSEGKGYRVYFNSENGTPVTLYPPLYPLLLSILYRVVGKENIFFYTYLCSMSVYIITIGILITLLAHFLKKIWEQFLILFLYTINYLNIRFCLQPMTEGLYMLLSFLVIMWWREFDTTQKWRYFYLAAGCAAILCWTKAFGMALCIALFIYTLLKYKFSFPTFISFLSFLPYLSFSYYSYILMGKTGYLGDILSSGAILRYKIGYWLFFIPAEILFAHLGPLFYRGLFKIGSTTYLSSVGLLSLTLWGIVFSYIYTSFKRNDIFIPLYMIAGSVAFIINNVTSPWWFFDISRLMLPLLPFFIIIIVDFFVKNGFFIALSLFTILYIITNLYNIILHYNRYKVLDDYEKFHKKVEKCIVSKNISYYAIYKICYNKEKIVINDGAEINNFKLSKNFLFIKDIMPLSNYKFIGCYEYFNFEEWKVRRLCVYSPF